MDKIIKIKALNSLILSTMNGKANYFARSQGDRPHGFFEN